MYMKALQQSVIGLFALLMSVATASAATWTILTPPSSPTVSAPEIDGAAGISALAALISIGLMAYDRLKS